MPEQAQTIHEIETDDPEGIEHYWHRRFDAKRARGGLRLTLPMSPRSSEGSFSDCGKRSLPTPCSGQEERHRLVVSGSELRQLHDIDSSLARL